VAAQSRRAVLALEGPHGAGARPPGSRGRRPDPPEHYIAKCGNTYSSEWFWSKIWHCLETWPPTSSRPPLLGRAGRLDSVRPRRRHRSRPKVVRGICAAGHKALYSDEWGGLPDKKFLAALDPRLADLRDRLYAGPTTRRRCRRARSARNGPAARPAGRHPDRDRRIRRPLRRDRLRRPRAPLVKVIGTSTCDCAVVSSRTGVPDIPGICGIVPGSILPGYYGIEAGQSAVGDIFAGGSRRSAAATRRSTPADAEAAAAPSPARAASWRSTGTTATGPSSSIRC
jgi:L-ribulokinase